MNYETEPWYKLYIRESTEDKVLPVLNRALRDFLLRFAKGREDPTILGKTTNPGEDLARALGAHQTEACQLVEFVQSMLDDGFLSHRKGRLWITNFVRAQEARTPGARRQKAYRAKHPKSRKGDAPETDASVTPEPESDVTVASRVTLQERREEKRREETKRDETTRAPEHSSGSPEFADGDEAEAMCATDLEQRAVAVGIPRMLAQRLRVSEAVVVHEIREFVGYWTIGAGAGQKRSHWLKKLREHVRQRHAKGQLTAPGAIAHAAHGGQGDAPQGIAPSPHAGDFAAALGAARRAVQ